MGQPAAKEGDQVMATDTHIILIPAAAGATVPTPLPHPFTGILDGGLSSDVSIMGLAAATVDSTATNTPSHIPQGGPFQSPPSFHPVRVFFSLVNNLLYSYKKVPSLN